MRALQTLLVGGLVLGVASPALAADTMTLDFIGTGKGKNTRISYNGSKQVVFAGQLEWEVDADTSGTYSEGDQIRTFCIDILQNAGDGTFTLGDVADAPIPGGGMGAVKAAMVEHLYANYFWLVNDGTATKNNAAAFQVAVWEIVNEDISVNSLSIADGAGKFYIDSNVTEGGWDAGDAARTTAEGWLAAVWAAHVTTSLDQFNGMFNALLSGGGQDQIIANIVPVPAPVMLGGAGLLGLAVLRRRRHAKKA